MAVTGPTRAGRRPPARGHLLPAALPVCLAAALAASLAGCGTPGLSVVGTVRDTTVTVPAPVVEAPAIDPDAGFATAYATGPQFGALSVVVVAGVPAAQGSHVDAGDVLATLDDAAQRAAADAADADASVARAEVDLLAQAIKDADDQASTLASQRKTLTKTISTLSANQKKLNKTLSGLTPTRKQLTGQLAAAQQALASLPPPGTPLPPDVTLPSREELEQAVAQLKAAIAKLDAGRKKLRDGLRKLDSGLAKARTGLKQLDDARGRLDDARQQLADVKELAQVASDATAVAVDAADWQLGLTTITAPVSGVVVTIVKPGAVLTPGAPLAVIRPDAPTLVDAWVSPAQRQRLCPGAAAQIRGDWTADPIDGTLAVLGSQATYPPTSITTDETHLTRAFEITVEASGALPAGVPVTITFPPSESDCHG